MYNRYIPQSDGSFRKNRIQDQRQPSPPQRPQNKPCDPPPVQQSCSHSAAEKSAFGFLRQLLPKEFDTGDLLIILLLLLIAGDCEEEKSSALLTLALYLLM